MRFFKLIKIRWKWFLRLV